MYKYENSFHNTSVMSSKSPAELDEILYHIIRGKATMSEKAFARRMRKTLCGVSGCTCGDDFGRR